MLRYLAADTAAPRVERLPFEKPNASTNPLASMLSLMMGGMMIFYAFFTGANSAQTILVEEEKGTFARLITTPTAVRSILGGKFLATLLTVLVQVIGLLIFSQLVFGIRWGQTLHVALTAVCMVICASTFGLFIISLLKNLKQTGAVFGGVITLTGMMGMATVFSGGAGANTNPVVRTLSLLVPQGWAMNGLRLTLDGAAFEQLIPFLLGLLVWSAVFFGVSLLRFRSRFAK